MFSLYLSLLRLTVTGSSSLKPLSQTVVITTVTIQPLRLSDGYTTATIQAYGMNRIRLRPPTGMGKNLGPSQAFWRIRPNRTKVRTGKPHCTVCTIRRFDPPWPHCVRGIWSGGSISRGCPRCAVT